MLVLTRKIDQAIVIGEDIVVRVLDVSGDRVKLGIAAPAGVLIMRQELCEEIRQANLEAATASPHDLRAILPKFRARAVRAELPKDS
ncbi:MAG: carbon storage regulator CsrA [Chloroflexi bacterium]|nr:carbon storage regulator CsrA [Chloroflexota bacterium]